MTPDQLPESDEQLTDLLSNIVLAPSRAQRDQILFACGEAAGRQRAMRTIRRQVAAVASVLLVIAGLGYALSGRGFRGEHRNKPDMVDRPVMSHPDKGGIVPHHADADNDPQLLVGSPIGHVLGLDRDRPGSSVDLPNEPFPSYTLQPVMTVASSWPLDGQE